MTNEINTAEIVWRLVHKIRGITNPSNAAKSITRLLFVKYVVDNCVGASTKEDMQEYVKAQKMLISRDGHKGAELLAGVMSIVESSFGIEGILSSRDNIAEYSEVMFGDDTAKAMDELARTDLEEKDDTNELGEDLVRNLIHLMKQYGTRGAIVSESTNSQLNMIVNELLSVERTDSFVDFVAGVGASTIDITKEAKPKISCLDSNIEAVTVAAMLLIMCGYTDFQVACKDTLRGPIIQELKGNKIFIDPPINYKVGECEGSIYTDATMVAIDKAVHHYLNEDGMAIVTSPSGLLFKQDHQSVMLRKNLIWEERISAVIALPAMWEHTNIGTNLLVLADNSDKNVVFVDAFTENRAKHERRGSLTDDQIKQIVDTVKSRKVIEGLSEVVDYEIVKENKYDLIPARYVKRKVIEETVSLEEIETELDSLYKQLYKLM